MEEHMSKFIIEDKFWELFPQAEIGVLLVTGIDNHKDGAAKQRSEEIASLLDEGNREAKGYLSLEVFSENPVVAVWREAFRKFKTKKGARCSIEALLKRAEKGNPVGSINPLVDLYNSVSLKYALPCGGEDVDAFQGHMRLTVSANGGEEFLALGDEERDDTLPGEVCYLDDGGAVCRCWNWRDGQRTMLTEDTTNAFLVIESVDPSRSADLSSALELLAARTKEFLGGEVRIELLNAANKEVNLC